jgi:CheY-like chemotaxis protein
LVSFPEAMMSNFVTLIVEDDPFQRECLADLLKSEGLEVVECANAAVAELVLASTGPDLRALVTDVELGGEMSGVELAQYAKRKFPECRTGLWTWRASHSARHPLSYEAL